MAYVNYLLSPFEGNINPVDPKGIKIYLQATEYINKETDKLDISVSNSKDIIDQFLSLGNKYVWVRFSFTVGTDADAKKKFYVVEKIQLEK